MKKSYDVLWAIISILIITFIIIVLYNGILIIRDMRDDKIKDIVAIEFKAKKEAFLLMQNAKNTDDIKKSLPEYKKVKVIPVNDIKYYRNRSGKYYHINYYYFDKNVISVSNIEDKTIFIVNKGDKIRFKSNKFHVINKERLMKYNKVNWGDRINDIKDTKYIIFTEDAVYSYIQAVWFCNENKDVIDVIFFY